MQTDWQEVKAGLLLVGGLVSVQRVCEVVAQEDSGLVE